MRIRQNNCAVSVEQLQTVAETFQEIYRLPYHIKGLSVFNNKNIFCYSYTADNSERSEIQSYFGRRMIIVGMLVTVSA